MERIKRLSRYPDEENQVKIHKIKPVQLVLAFYYI